MVKDRPAVVGSISTTPALDNTEISKCCIEKTFRGNVVVLGDVYEESEWEMI